MEFVFNEESIPPGGQRHFKFPVATSAGGHDIYISVHALAGLKPGPSVLVTAGSHGEELWSTEFIRRLYVHFATHLSELSGMLLLAPLLSPTSFEARSRHTPYDYHNLNRVFPGVPAGRGWFTEVLADVIARNLLPQADIVFDYHGGGADTTISYHYTVAHDDPNFATIQRVALASGSPVHWTVHETRSTLSSEFGRLGRPAIVPEVGGGGVIENEVLFHDAISRFENMLRALNLYTGSPKITMPSYAVSEGCAVRPGQGGIFLPAVELQHLGQEVSGGTLLGRVISPLTFEVLDELIAPYRRTVLMQVRNRISIVQPGDYAYIVGDGDSAVEPVDPGPLTLSGNTWSHS